MKKCSCVTLNQVNACFVSGNYTMFTFKKTAFPYCTKTINFSNAFQDRTFRLS